MQFRWLLSGENPRIAELETRIAELEEVLRSGDGAGAAQELDLHEVLPKRVERSYWLSTGTLVAAGMATGLSTRMSTV